MLSLSDDGRCFTTLQGFSEIADVEILGEELAYNKEYKQYKILILSQPLDTKFIFKKDSAVKTQENNLYKPKLSVTDCESFLYSFAEFKEVLDRLQLDIKHFLKHYMVLPDYLDDAANRLKDMTYKALKEMISKLKAPMNSDVKLKEAIAGSIESFIMNAVYEKTFAVIQEHLLVKDQSLFAKCERIQQIRAHEMGVRKEFCCPLPSAIDELSRLPSLHTPREKLTCLKCTIDNITESITAFINEGIELLQAIQPTDQACITSDDLLPILVTVIAKAKCRYLHSDMFYMEHFMWVSTDLDNLGFCLVSFKAAVEYMMKTDFSEMFEPIVSTQASSEKVLTDAPQTHQTKVRSAESSGPDRYERQINKISGLLEKTVLQTSNQRGQTRQIQSIFPERQLAAVPASSQPSQKKQSSQLGDFLSALQDDDFDQPYGKQT
ncbi:ankyrin repeat domain-containing protein 27-like isoform X2 [Physella acuta]|nr:ankyrin repeat domain-containing protein 27-like isoform X2 [Physella acuta]